MGAGPRDPEERLPDDESVRPIDRGRPVRPPGQGPAPRFPVPTGRDPTHDPRNHRYDPRLDPAASDPRGEEYPMPRDPSASDPRGQRYATSRDPTDPRGVRAVRGGGGTTRSGGGLPMMPTLLIAGVAIVFAFVLGRVTGGDSQSGVQAAPVETRSTSSGPERHTVKSGESLLGIASRYGVTAEALAAANDITDQNHVFVGQVLVIPESTLTPISTTTTTKAKS